MEVNVYDNLYQVLQSPSPSQAEEQVTEEALVDSAELSEQSAPTSAAKAGQSLSPPQHTTISQLREEESHQRPVSQGSEVSSDPSEVNLVPTTTEEALKLIRDAATELYRDAKDYPTYESTSSKEHKGPVKLWKLNWQLAIWTGVLVLLNDDMVTAHGCIELNLDRWMGKYDLAQWDIKRMLEHIKHSAMELASIWMGEREKNKKLEEALSAGLEEQDMEGLNIAVTPDGKGKEKATGHEAEGGRGREEVVTTGTKRSAPNPSDIHQTPRKKQKQAKAQQDKQAERKKRGAEELKAHKRSHGRAAIFWMLAGRLWPRDKAKAWLEALESDMGRITNIIPMEPTAQDMFDRLEFPLKPYCPLGSNRRILLEVDMELACQISVKNREDGSVGYTIKRKADKHQQRGQFLTNYRKSIVGENGRRGLEELVHGNVIEIITPDPKRLPLPDYGIVDATYRLTRFVGALRAADLIREVFRGPTPDVDPVPASSQGRKGLGSFEEMKLDLAVAAGAMTREDQGRWRAYAIIEARERILDTIRKAYEKDVLWPYISDD